VPSHRCMHPHVVDQSVVLVTHHNVVSAPADREARLRDAVIETESVLRCGGPRSHCWPFRLVETVRTGRSARRAPGQRCLVA
jgi:hypothetical protein